MNHYVIFFCTSGTDVLLAQRHEGWWSCGSGTMDRPGELDEKTVRREVREEFGVTPLSVTRLGFRQEPGIDGKEAVIHDFHVEVSRGDVTNAAPEEHVELGWFDMRRQDTWPKPWHPYLQALVRNYQERLFELVPIRPEPKITI